MTIAGMPTASESSTGKSEPLSDFLCWLHPSRPLETGPVAPTRSLHHLGDGACGIAGESAIAEDGILGAMTGHPRWLDPELAELASSRGNVSAALAARRRHGDGFLERIAGDFALVIVDPKSNDLIAAIDRLGQASLYYARCRDGVVLATRRQLLSEHPDAPSDIAPQSIHDYLYFHMIPAPNTLYTDMEKLPGAHRLRLSGQDIAVERYWVPQFSEAPVNEAAFGRDLHGVLDRAVARRLATGTGSFLSGGLDSSTVTGLHAGQDPAGAHAYSIGFDVPGYDEMEYARLAARHFNVPLSEYYATPDDIADTVETVVRSFDEPFGNSSALPAYLCARMARDNGMTRLLAGDGGDELFAGNARYAKQGLFEQYFRIPRALRAGLFEPMLLGPAGNLPGLRKGRSYIEQALVPLPDRMENYNFLHRIDPAIVFDPDFLESVDRQHPIEHLRELYTAPSEAGTLNRMLYLDWQITLADNDLRKVNGACRLAGIDVTYPMLDDDVVAFSCQIPSTAKLPGNKLRHFYKQAFRGFLPEAVIDKRKHGFGLPFGMWLRDDRRLHELAQDMIRKVRSHGWIRGQFIDDLMQVHLRDHPSYYGEFVWVLMALGIWLEHNGS